MIILALLFIVGFLIGYVFGREVKNRRDKNTWVSPKYTFKPSKKKALVVDLQDPLDIDLGDLK